MVYRAMLFTNYYQDRDKHNIWIGTFPRDSIFLMGIRSKFHRYFTKYQLIQDIALSQSGSVGCNAATGIYIFERSKTKNSPWR
jgi:hypothetical protein